ncbi:DUF3592 domain-containing protein [Hymenobacter nivis]|uniref:DUF3592 domain-containing protein n=1 Tax=Hymenobacter nivis TaxID=1850093 RepID=A0A2Z3GG55_9BACT|nr:DUF3592 domain-containing protein [Hymenobacter nivis]AWM31838.1 hypothetical protein DDQ68_02975 [Hymenobacter nivis]
MDWFFIVWMIFIAILAIRGYAKDYQQRQKLREHGVQVQGTVVRNKFILSRISVFRPVIRFETTQGETIEEIDYSGWAMAFPRFTKGEKVALIYELDNPKNFKLI